MIALATLLHDSGRPAAAEPLFRRGMEIQRQTLGEQHSATIKTLNSLGGFYLDCGNPAAAEPILRAALRGIERSKGSQHPDLIYNLHWLANLVHEKGDLTEAEQLEARAVAIGEKAHVKTRGETIGSLRHLACLKLETGQRREGCALAIRTQQLFEKALSESLSFTSESERLQDHSTRQGLSLLASAGLAGPLTAAVLHTKGIVLDSMLEDRAAAEASASAETRDLLRQLQTGKVEAAQNLGHAAIAQTSSVPALESDEQTNQRVADAESNLARYHTGLGRARRAFCITVEQVQGALPVDAVLIELLRYSQYLGTNRWEPRYGAILLPKPGSPIWLPLGAAAHVEGLVKRYQHALRGQGEQGELARVLEDLSAQLWAPLASHLPSGTRQVIISPDGELNFVSFATLLTPEKRFVGEAVSISYVASGRDLLSPEEPARGATDLEVWANPDFGVELPLVASAPPPLPTNRSIVARELRDWNFTPLPGAEDEGRLLQSHASELGFGRVQLHLGKDATEAELRRVQAPHVLHLATHGFILPEASSGAESGHGARRLNPMRRSGLALAGAQRTLAAWARGCAPPAENDGIITAEEVGSLNLHGTWLVTVAACDSGAGQAQAGEGVLGLRRGFMQAGTQNLLLTLWPIDDAQTAPFMSEFYAAAHKEHSATAALSEVQRRWLRRLRVERGLAEACQVAGPYILSFQGHDQRP
jgi:CHAT domain-containing protein